MQPRENPRAKLPLSQRLLLWAPSVAVAIALPLNFFAGFPVILIVLFIALLLCLRSVGRAEQRRDGIVRQTDPDGEGSADSPGFALSSSAGKSGGKASITGQGNLTGVMYLTRHSPMKE